MNKALIFLALFLSVLLSACSRTSETVNTPTTTKTPLTSQPSIEPIVETGVVIEDPEENAAISSPVVIKGLAPGPWFFEGQIEGELISESGKLLVSFPLQAVGEWMTEEHVRFEGEAKFSALENEETIRLIIKNDNPSGLPENAKSQSFIFRLKR